MNFNLTLTEQDMQILNNALVEQPFKHVVGLIQKINQQVNAQVTKEVTDVVTGNT